MEFDIFHKAIRPLGDDGHHFYFFIFKKRQKYGSLDQLMQVCDILDKYKNVDVLERNCRTL